MGSEPSAFRRLVDYFIDDAEGADRLFTVFMLALILGGLASCFGSSCHVTISINSKASEASHGK